MIMYIFKDRPSKLLRNGPWHTAVGHHVHGLSPCGTSGNIFPAYAFLDRHDPKVPDIDSSFNKLSGRENSYERITKKDRNIVSHEEFKKHFRIKAELQLSGLWYPKLIQSSFLFPFSWCSSLTQLSEARRTSWRSFFLCVYSHKGSPW